jgi:hypothetical protein
MRRPRLTFGREGTLLEWTISDRRDKDDYADCTRHPFFGFKRQIGGRVVYYYRGNHGDSAWICLKSVGIDLWIANETGRPSRATAMRMVASAYRA